MRNKDKIPQLLPVSILSMLLLCILFKITQYEMPRIFINEVCSWNETIVKDSDRDYNDYIELYNASSETVSLKGWYLSDDEQDLKKYRLGEEIWIEPKDYLVLFANGREDLLDSLGFRINAEGESIFLADCDGYLVDSIYVPKLEADTAYSRTSDGNDEWAKMEPSPGTTNTDSSILPEKILAAPVFSHAGGFYPASFLLSIKANGGETIYYTTDGSIPSEASLVYTDEILIENHSNLPNIYNSVQNIVEDWKNYTPLTEPVNKAMIIRAMAVDDDHHISEIVTNTYFVGLPEYEQQDVISLVADPEDWFGENGIYVTGKAYDEWYLSHSEEKKPRPNFQRKGREWEIEGNVEFLETGVEVLNQKAGIRIQGSGSRAYIPRRFNVYARREYSGTEYFDYELFEGKKMHSFALRFGFANVFMQDLMKERDIAIQEARPVTVFLNGEYWYTTYLQERYNKHYLHEMYGVDPDNVLIIKDEDVSEGIEEDYILVEQLLAEMELYEAKQHLTYKELEQMIDIQNFIDYMCANVYFCNMDMGIEGNSVFWRTVEKENETYGDGRWRWMMFDLDAVEWNDIRFYGVDNKAEINSFSWEREVGGDTLSEYPVYAALKKNEEFRKQFVLTFMDLVNTTFSVEHVEEKLKEWGADLSWENYFFAKRADYIVPYLAEEFALEGSLAQLTLQVNNGEAGYIRLNTITPDLKEGIWSGNYYTDYPVELCAVAKEGYRFVGWEGVADRIEDRISVKLQPDGLTLTAIFERVEDEK